MYALEQQAQEGDCRAPKPWAWDLVESAKWSSWKQLERMSKMEAMRLFVRALEGEMVSEGWHVLCCAHYSSMSLGGRPCVSVPGCLHPLF